MDRIAVLIPCRNEEMTIHALDKNMKLEHICVGYKDRGEGSREEVQIQ